MIRYASREQIDQVRSSVDIVDVVRDYVPSLKQAGRSVRGLCPFHSERTPSFHVHPEKGLFKCFGCGESGDVIAFVSKLEQVGFADALEMLAARAGITLRPADAVEKRESEGHKEKLHRALESAREYYEDRLWDERAGGSARAYLAGRGILDDTVRRFRLGFAPPAGSGAFEALLKKGFSIELCQQAGLVARSAAGRFYDPLFGRLIFPIHDNFGHTVGFGGRVLPVRKSILAPSGTEGADEGPKYLNSPETPVFSKGKTLYGLFQAKAQILALRRVVVVEGYMDVIGLHQAGFTDAVATLGTALTRDHAKVLKRYALDVVAFFDPDDAGRRAAMKGLDPLLQEDFFPRVVATEETEDPDDIIRSKGPGFFEELLKRAPDFVEYALKALLPPGEVSLQQKSAAAKRLLELINQSPNEILKSEWTARVATGLGLRLDSLERELLKTPGVKSDGGQRALPVRGGREPRLPSVDEEVLQLILAKPGAWVLEDWSENDFLTDRCRRVYALMKDQMQTSGRLAAPELYDRLPDGDKEWFVGLMLEEIEYSDPKERMEQLVRNIRYLKDKSRLAVLIELMRNGTATPGEQSEYGELQRRIKGAGARAVKNFAS